MVRKGLAIASLFFVAGLGLSGCGGSAASISIAITPSATSVDGTDSVTLTAAVTNDKNAAGVSWSVSGGGTLSNTTTTSATFTAPAATASAQTVTITATSLADATKTLSLTITVAAKPAVTTTGASLSASVGAAYSIQLTGSGGVSPYTWSVTAGTLPPCLSMSTSGLITGTITAACAGTYSPVFTMTDSGTPTKLTATTTLNVTIAAAPAIGFTGAVPATATYNAVYIGSAAAAGGASALSYTLASGALPTGLSLNAASGAITGTPTATGTFAFTVMAADAFGDSATQGYSITANPATPTLAFTAIAAHTFGDAAFTVSATSASSGVVTYTVTSGPATIAGNSVTITGVGTVVLGASQAATTNYTAASASTSFTVNPETPTLTFAAIPTHTFGDAPFTVSATSASSGAVTYSVTSGPATIAGNTVTLTGGGTVVLGASQAANGNYGTATGSISFTVSPATATLTFTAIPDHTFGDAPFTVSATSASSGAVTYSVTSGPATVAGNTVTLTGVGPVVLGASQAATANYTTATASTSFTVNIGTPTLVFAAIPNHAFSDPPFAVSATSASTGAVTYSVTSGPATIAGNTVTLTGVGTVVLGASQAATANYTSATASTSFSVGLAVPTLTFAAIPTHTFGDAPFAVSATSASSGAVTYSVTSGPATIAGNTITLTGAGTVVLGASQAATANYTSATASTSFTVNPATPTLTFTAIPTHTFGDAPFAVSATSASSGAVTYSVTSGPATILGNTVTLTGSGTVVLGASQAATANYTAATASTSFAVNPALSITTSTTLPSGSVSIPYSQSLAATGGSGTYTNWTVTSGAALLGTLNLSLSAGGVLSGTPLTNGSATFTAQVTDSQGHTASATFMITVYASLTVTTLSLPATNVGASYSQQLAAAGGSGTGYSWTATSSNLSTYGLSLSTGGLITGTVAQAGTASFTANVKDSSNNTATQALTITVYSALALPSPDPSSLPSSGYTNVAYTGTINASGGSGNYSWQVTGLSDNLTSSPVGGALTISGTPGASPATVTFNVTLTDTTTNASVTQNGYSIVISAPTPVSLPTPSSTVPGAATVNQSYNGAITVTGGVSPYTWSINGVTVTGGGLALSNGLSASSSGGTSLTITGTPTTTTSVILTNVKVQDSIGSNQTNSYTIAVNSAGSNVSGQIFLNNNCGTGGTQPTFTVSINTTPTATTTTTDSSGNYSFSGIPNGTYTITPSIPGATSSLFSPASYTGVALNNVTNNNVTGQNFTAAVGYTVSGTVSYTNGGAPQTGPTFLTLNNNNCGGSGGPGTGISNTTLTSGGAFTIRSVPPGSYTLTAWMDSIGAGLQNAINPTGSSSVTVSNANVSNAAVTMTNPAVATPTSNPSINAVVPNAQGVLIEFSPSKNSNGIEDANQYTVEWSTSPTLGGGTGGAQFLNLAGSHTFSANGKDGVWILSNAVAGAGSFVSGQTYYFQARAFNTLDIANPHPSGWCNYTASGCSATTGFTGVTIGTPACTGTCTTVSGSVTIPAGITVQSGASLYLGLIELGSSGGNPIGIYMNEITNPPTGANNYTVTVPSGANYAVIGILDQKNVGEFAPGVVTNVRGNVPANITVSGSSMSGQNATLPNTGSSVQVQTDYNQNTYSGGSSTSYSLNFNVNEENNLPIAVTMTSGPNLLNNNGVVAIDMGNCTQCGNPQFDYYLNLPGGAPAVNDTYTFTVTYSDGTQDTGSTINGQVTAFGSTGAIVGPSDLVTNLAPSATSLTSLTPTFTWTFPSGASTANYFYSFYISPTSCSGSCSNVWQIPGNNSKSNGFTYAETGSGTTGSLTWGTDPIPGDNSSPTGNLVLNTSYNWSIQIQDINGNQAQTTTWYKP